MEDDAKFSAIRDLPGAYVKTGRGNRAERMHAHQEHSVSIVQTGSTTLSVANSALRMEAGQCVYIPPGVCHLCTPDDPATFSYRVVYWGDAAHLSLGLGSERFVSCGFAREETDGASAVAALYDSCREGNLWVVTPTEPALGEKFLRDYRPGDDESRYRAYRRCRSRYGAAPRELATNARVERAKTLLRRGLSVAETAATCGFCDQSHFDRVFRRYTGLTPSAFAAGKEPIEGPITQGPEFFRR